MLTILMKSGLSEAPPTRKPSISDWAARASQLPAFTEPVCVCVYMCVCTCACVCSVERSQAYENGIPTCMCFWLYRLGQNMPKYSPIMVFPIFPNLATPIKPKIVRMHVRRTVGVWG